MKASTKDLKRIIKSLVRESLAEIFVEMNLKEIVQESIRSHVDVMKVTESPVASYQVPVMNQAGYHPAMGAGAPMPAQPQATPYAGAAPMQAPIQADTGAQRSLLRERLGVSEDEWRDIYSDTADSENPIILNDGGTEPELVSEEQLRAAGLYQDFSRFNF